MPSLVLKSWVTSVMSAMLCATSASAQNFPTKPVKLSAPYSAGAAPVVFTRTVADKLAKLWGQPVIVDAKPGASGRVPAAAAKYSQARETMPGDSWSRTRSASSVVYSRIRN